jgi:FAD/FMN-containing dehydrogenase
MIKLHEKSLLVEVGGEVKMSALQQFLEEQGYSLAPRPLPAYALEQTVAEWIGHGAPGGPDPFADPADHLIAGLEATLHGRNVGAERLALHLRPCPRRAAGPDWVALFFGTQGKMGSLHRLWLRATPRDRSPAPMPFARERSPELTEQEQRYLVGIENALRGT